jgi:hypothetical protein
MGLRGWGLGGAEEGLGVGGSRRVAGVPAVGVETFQESIEQDDEHSLPSFPRLQSVFGV